MNAIMTIRPYRFNNTWVFDDADVGLVREPFVAGVPEMIDEMVRRTPGAERGFRLLFSAGEFPGSQAMLEWVREEVEGNWYRWVGTERQGWLCPALFKYFEAAPRRLFVRLEPVAAGEGEPELRVSRREAEQLLELLRAGDLAGARAMVEAALA